MPIDHTAFVRSMLDHTLDALRDSEKPGTITEFEQQLFDLLMALGCAVIRALFERLDAAATNERLRMPGWRLKGRHDKRYTTRFGALTYGRRVVQRTRNGSVHSPLDDRLRLPRGNVTPLAAKLVVRCCAHMTTRAAAVLLSALGGLKPSRSTIHRLIQDFGDRVDAYRAETMSLLEVRAEAPPEAVAVAVMLDGVMAHMVEDRRQQLKAKARREGRQVRGPVGYRECSVGALAFFDKEGKRLDTVRVAKMPEADKASLKTALRQLLVHVRSRRPDLVVVAVSDGAANNWSFLESLQPDHQVVDYFHTLEHIQRRLNRALGVGSHANQRRFRQLRRLLLQPGGHVRVFSSIERLERRCGTYKPRRRKGKGAQPTFYERHARRMPYAALRAMKLPIGSGVIEGTARHIVVDRLRQTGMRWKRAGGQAVLDIRTAVVNLIFDALWGVVTPEPACVGR